MTNPTRTPPTRTPRRSIGGPGLLLAFSATLALAFVPPSQLSGQDQSVTWTEVTRIEAPGSLGVLIQAMPGGADARESQHGIHVMGNRIRHDRGSVSTIMDMDERRWTTVDHQDQSYTSIGPEEMEAMVSAFGDVADEIAEELQLEADEAEAEWEEAMEQMRLAMEEATAGMEVRLDSRATGERRDFHGFPAEGHRITGEVELQEEVQGLDNGEGGTLVILVDLWQSADFPNPDRIAEEWAQQLAQDERMQGLAEEMADAVEPLTGAFGPEALAAWDPRIAAGVAQISEALETLEGVTVQRVVRVAMVPEGASLDEEALLAWDPESMGSQLQSAAGDAARDAAGDAAREAMGGLTGGLFGGGGDDEEEEAEESPETRPLLRISTELEGVELGEASPELFEPGAGYSERPLPTF